MAGTHDGQTVNITLLAPGRARVGVPVTLQANVNPSTVEGDISFDGVDGAVPTMPAVDGEAVVQVTFTAPGPHGVRARFYDGGPIGPVYSAEQLVNVLAEGVVDQTGG